eukprot:TRINITY_DN856_c0_g2_i1.p1 TRINITY_DN856_c0_g2~~TRINITY_DN856_c0_g2_i1.p1  ORF type:complete len:180 (-),score=54.08 TRINITY_DN856_c0_g2_i1:70-609(-)
MGNWLSSLLDYFFSKNLDICLVGLDNSGKTTLLNILAHGHPIETIPTLGQNVKTIRQQGVSMKVWDIGGQLQFRNTWDKYCAECNCIIFMVDMADPSRLDEAKKELHQLLEHKELNGLPLLIAGNKIDLPNRLLKEDLMEGLNLDYITENQVGVIEISALEQTNVDQVIEWLVERAPEK